MKYHIKFQLGLTLIELMISMVLSLIVIFAVGSILISSNQAASVSDTLSDSQETGRFSVDYMNRQLLRTGYDPEEVGVLPFADTCPAGGNVICINENPDGTGDRLAVRRVAEPDETNAVTCYGSELLGADGSTITENVTVTDVYWVEADDNGLSSLRCQSFDEEGTILTSPGDSFGNAQSLAAGVLSMHILYGQSSVTPTNETLNVTTYYNADQVTDWSNVYSIRLGFMTRALTETDVPSRTQNYTVLDSIPYSFTDEIARQVFTTTVTLLN